MTSMSPLQLKRHLFTGVSIQANPKGSAEAEVSIEPTVSFQKNEENDRKWILSLDVVAKSAKPEVPFFYTANIQIIGSVEVHESFDPNKREQLAVVNGLGLLYSAIREMVLNITGRSVHGPWSLPTLNFVEIVAKSKEAAKARESTASPRSSMPSSASEN